MQNHWSTEIKYPYMPAGRTISFAPENNVFMVEAKRIRDEESTDLNHSTGAVVVLDGKILGKGANQSALGNKKLLALHKNGLCVRRILKIQSGQKYCLCPGCASSKHHAETRAVKDALCNAEKNSLPIKIDNGVLSKIAGADLYLFGHWWCCKPCWDSMINAGIKDVYVIEDAYKKFGK